MANGDIDNPVSNGNVLTSQTDCCKSTSDTDNMEESTEFRVMMAYAQRRRRPKKNVQSSKPETPELLNEATSPQAPAKTEEETPKVEERKKRKGGFKKLKHFFRCIRPQIEDEEPQQPQEAPGTPNDVNDRCLTIASGDEVRNDKYDEVASRLAEIADEIPFLPPELESDLPELESDSPELESDAPEPEKKKPDDMEKVIGLLLRKHGDKLNDSELGKSLTAMNLFWDYSFFERLISALLRSMGLATNNSPGPQTSPKTQMAITCEVASRLDASGTVAMNRMLGFGAQYLQNHFSSWMQQQGGLEAAFDSDDDDDDDDEVQ